MTIKKAIPKEKCLDQTIKLLMEGYLYIPSRCSKLHSDIFETRLMGKRVICMSGENAAELFYNKHLFTRTGVMPMRIQKSLFGVKAIQTLEGGEHSNRKSLFMSLMTPDYIDRLITITKKEWMKAAMRFMNRESIVLYDEASIVMCRAALRWAGVPFTRREIGLRARDMSAMIDSFGAVGPRHLKGRQARRRTESWMESIIRQVRYGIIKIPENTALNQMSFHRDLKHKLLDAKMAGIELINILRPITAIATYVTFGALALQLHPACKRKLQAEEGNYSHMFAQEIRRFYPFAPFLGAKVKHDLLYNNYYFKKGTLVFLDLYGTNHDPRIWKNPYRFWPEHFLFRDGNPYDFVPQGGGDPESGHRCPGEWITVELIKASMEFLTGKLIYSVPYQDFGYDLRRMPTRPASGFIITDVILRD